MGDISRDDLRKVLEAMSKKNARPMERQGKLRIAPYFDNRGFTPASGVELIFCDG
jgi:hypothetical protein